MMVLAGTFNIPLRTDSGYVKERRILIGPWWPAKAAPVWNYLEKESKG